MKRTPLKSDPDKVREFVQRGRENSRMGKDRSGRPKPRAISPASPVQRRAMRGQVCIFCGVEHGDFARITPSHLWPRGMGGCDAARCVLPMCVRPGGRGCHSAYERGELDLLPILVADWDRYREHFCHALEHATPVELLQQLAGARIEWSDREAA